MSTTRGRSGSNGQNTAKYNTNKDPPNIAPMQLRQWRVDVGSVSPMKIVDKLKTDSECFHLQQPVLTTSPTPSELPPLQVQR